VYDDLRGGDGSSLKQRLDVIPTDRDVVVVCKMGFVAKRATALLADEGYDAATLLGGMSGWHGYQQGSLSYKLRSLLWRLR
jgi:rhodanese-related sulfurtransferase